MPLRIRLGRHAKNDQRSIWHYVAQDNVTAADQLIERFAESFRILAVHPEAGRLLSELSADLRAFPVGTYRIFYRASPTIIDIVRVLHAARDVTPELLND